MPSFRNAVAIMSDPLAPARPPSRPPVRHTPPSPPDAKTPAWMPSNRELKILLLEDAQDDAELIVHTLRKGGLVFGSKRVQTRQALVEAFIEFRPDILLCDNALPGFDAGTAIQIASTVCPDLPIVIVTGTLEDEAAVELVKAGASDFIRKDRLGRLPIAVTVALERAHQRRMQAERDAAVLTSELRHRRRFETAMDGIIVANATTQIIYDVNQSLVNLLGYSRADCLGRTLAEIGIRSEDGEELPVAEMAGTGDRYQCASMPLRVRDGGELEVEVVAAVYQVGQEATLQCNLRDVTVQKSFEKRLRDKNRQLEAANLVKNQFLASMSHELRTPLNGILGFTGILLMKIPGDLTSEQEKQLKTMRDCGNHLLSLINDLLNLAKIESGNVELGKEAVDCKKLINEICASLGSVAAAKQLQLRSIVPAEEIVVTSTQRAVWQIVTNLAANAIKFTAHGQVSLEVCKVVTNDVSRVEISVVDSGIGVRPADQAKLFLAFSRIDEKANGQEGTGLGLYISQKLARFIGGEITLVSEYGKGSKFTLTLPGDTGDA
jgi:PAS domain S-box-containing protein